MLRCALFNPSRTHRYSLWRQWDSALPVLCWVLLNPSAADEDMDDPTSRRCIRFAQTWGYGSMTVVNLFALCSASPHLLYISDDPVGTENDTHILGAATASQTTILAWGNHGALHNRAGAVLRLTDTVPNRQTLGSTGKDQPRHPLYLPSHTTPTPIR